MFAVVKNKTLLLTLLLVSVLIGYLIFEAMRNTYYKNSDVLLDGNSTPTEGAYRRVENALKQVDEDRINALIDENPKLVERLISKIQSYPLNQSLNDDELEAFLESVRILNRLVHSPYKSKLFASFYNDTGSSRRFTNYIGAKIANYRRLGNGAIVGLMNPEIQFAVFEAFKLLSNLKETRDIDAELDQVAAWYQVEIEYKAHNDILSPLLLGHAWRLVSLKFQSRQKNLTANFDNLSISTASDLTRLLNHDDSSVVMKSAKLIETFSPENATTALRYSLIKNKDNAVRFLILDAMKSYGEQRTQFETLLSKLVRTTNDAAFREKILETIDHLNGLHGSVGFSS